MKLATITAVFNEEDLVGQYLRHYEPLVDKILLLDNGSTDQTLEIARTCPKVDVATFETPPRVSFEGPKHDAVTGTFARLRGEYDYVLLVDIDEFVTSRIADNLKEVFEKLPNIDVFKCRGYSMLPMAAYDPLVSILAQKGMGFPDALYSKPCIARPDAYPIFGAGIHSVDGISTPRIASGAFNLYHYPGPTEEIFLKRRLGKEPRVHCTRTRKTEAYFRKQLASWRANKGLEVVF